MSVASPVSAPGRFVPLQALAFSAPDGGSVQVDPAHPLPVAQALTEASSTAMSGSAAAALTVGPFAPELGRPIWLTLSGTWTGSAQMLRSVDGGATKLPVTLAGEVWGRFTANANEPLIEETDAAATYWLQLSPATGAISYRVSQ